MKMRPVVAIVYDFDGTISPGNTLEESCIPPIGDTGDPFWVEVRLEAKKHGADQILIFMKLLLEKARAASRPICREDFLAIGRHLEFFPGIVPGSTSGKKEKCWFDRIQSYGKKNDLKIEHYLISSGIREVLEGTPVFRKFKAVFASSFCYDGNGLATWPALAINYTSKTEFLFRINKGCLSVFDDRSINRHVPEECRPVPFSRIIYIGDGETDIPCFRVVKSLGGNPISVFKPGSVKKRQKALDQLDNGRVNYVSPADYRPGSELDGIVKSLIDDIRLACPG